MLVENICTWPDVQRSVVTLSFLIYSDWRVMVMYEIYCVREQRKKKKKKFRKKKKRKKKYVWQRIE